MVSDGLTNGTVAARGDDSDILRVPRADADPWANELMNSSWRGAKQPMAVSVSHRDKQRGEELLLVTRIFIVIFYLCGLAAQVRYAATKITRILLCVQNKR